MNDDDTARHDVPNIGDMRGYRTNPNQAMLLFHYRGGLVQEYEDSMDDLHVDPQLPAGVEVKILPPLFLGCACHSAQMHYSLPHTHPLSDSL